MFGCDGQDSSWKQKRELKGSPASRWNHHNDRCAGRRRQVHEPVEATSQSPYRQGEALLLLASFQQSRAWISARCYFGRGGFTLGAAIGYSYSAELSTGMQTRRSE